MKAEVEQMKNLFYVNRRYAVLLLLIFFTVGIAGMAIPGTRDLFLGLFPFALVLSFASLLVFSFDLLSVRSLTSILAVIILGFLIEAAGVSTGKIFGNYRYGDTLGPKFLDTPLIIGINWAMMVFTTYSITDRLKVDPFIKILTASLLMVFYDFFLEKVAGRIDMWHWENTMVPVQNYLAWFIISFLFHALIKLNRFKAFFYLALPLFLCQTVFMAFLTFYLRRS
jgi:putative membrane protein